MKTILFGRSYGTLSDVVAVKKRVNRFEDMWVEVTELPNYEARTVLKAEGNIMEEDGTCKTIPFVKERNFERALANNVPIYEIKVYAEKLSAADLMIAVRVNKMLDDMTVHIKLAKKRPADFENRSKLYYLAKALSDLRFTED